MMSKLHGVHCGDGRARMRCLAAALAALSALALIGVAGCVVQPTGESRSGTSGGSTPPDRRPEPPRPTPAPATPSPPKPAPAPMPTPPPAPAPAQPSPFLGKAAAQPEVSKAKPNCAPGSAEIGVLVVTSATVKVNTQVASTGRTICDGDHISTDGSGVADVIISGNHQSDSIHFAENTDPRLRRTAGGCISVDRFRHGTMVVSTRKLCMVVQTADLLVYQPPQSRNQFVQASGAPTQLKAFFGAAPVKLQPTSEVAVRNLSSQQLLARTAPPATQPKAGAVNVYKSDALVAPPRTLTQPEVQLINQMRLRMPPALQITKP